MPLDTAGHLFRLGAGLQKLNKRMERSIGMSLAQWYVLRCLIGMPGVAAGVLAKEVGVHPGTLTPLLKRLRRRGMLFIEKDEFDSRKKTLLISREGRSRLLEIERRLAEIIGERERGLQLNSDLEEFIHRCNNAVN